VADDNVVGITSRVDFDLDAEEQKLEKRPDLYVTRVGRVPKEGIDPEELDPDNPDHWETGVKVRLRITDPNRVDWRILVGLDDEIELLRYIVPEESDKDFLRNNVIPVELMLVFVKKIVSHFGRPEAMGTGKKLPI
jgi:hypothetical protein